jgi:predicted DNA-binding ArsR family transcriptional regulator
MADVVLNIKLDTEEVKEKTEELISLLKTANSLVNELADNLSHLEVDVER